MEGHPAAMKLSLADAKHDLGLDVSLMVHDDTERHET